VVKKTLADIGAAEIPTILVLNKIDLIKPTEEEPLDLDAMKGYYREKGFEHVIFISAHQRENIDALRNMIYEEVKKKHLKIYPNFLPQSY
jgi:GTP-binding protein HflX